VRGRRILVSGMGGELGSLVAAKLESEPWVGSLMGIDVDPPRRRLRRAEFHRIEPSHRDRIVDVVTAFNPHVLIHLAVWEPDARAGTAHAKQFTDAAMTATIGAAAECSALEAIVVRSGIEIYGRARNSLSRPDESVAPAPTSEYGRMVERVEAMGRSVADRIGVPVAAIRLAPVIGPHVPSPLGRLLRQSVVPFSALADPPFTVIEVDDAARAIVTAAERQASGPLNIVAPGAVTALQAILRGRRVPLPLIGPDWAIARRLSHLLGAPIPDHVAEVLHRGRLADGARAADVLGFSASTSTPEAIQRLYAWESVVRIDPRARRVA
jgi:UDP-glucose 4-epimerase